MRIGDLVIKKGKSKHKMLGIVVEIGETCRIVRVFWSEDYGTFWTPVQSLRKIQ